MINVLKNHTFCHYFHPFLVFTKSIRQTQWLAAVTITQTHLTKRDSNKVTTFHKLRNVEMHVTNEENTLTN